MHADPTLAALAAAIRVLDQLRTGRDGQKFTHVDSRHWSAIEVQTTIERGQAVLDATKAEPEPPR